MTGGTGRWAVLAGLGLGVGALYAALPPAARRQCDLRALAAAERAAGWLARAAGRFAMQAELRGFGARYELPETLGRAREFFDRAYKLRTDTY